MSIDITTDLMPELQEFMKEKGFKTFTDVQLKAYKAMGETHDLRILAPTGLEKPCLMCCQWFNT